MIVNRGSSGIQHAGMEIGGKRLSLEDDCHEVINSDSDNYQNENQNAVMQTSINNEQQAKIPFGEQCFPHSETRHQRHAGENVYLGSPGKVHFQPNPLTGLVQSHSAEGVRTLPRVGIKDGAYFLSPRQLTHGHINYGTSMRSDAYLRQALTSPYNRRTKEDLFSTSGSSHQGNGTSHMTVVSPYTFSGRTASVLKQDDGTRHWNQKETAGQEIFKTPIRREESMHLKHRRQHHEMSPPSSASSDSSSRSHPFPHNPFEIGSDRLHFPLFSPGVLHTTSTPSSADGASFRWNIEHLAELRPVHIDEKDIRRQLARRSPDRDVEERAQKAIDYYFSNHLVAPSPWAEAPPPHVLPATPVYALDYVMSTPDEIQGAFKKDLGRTKKMADCKDCASQTALTLPVDFEIQNVLGDHMTYQEPEESNGDGMSTSSLRRKLFFNADCSSVLSPVRTGVESPDHLTAALRSPSPHNVLEKGTPEWERESPVHTPSSVQFSSSPIRGVGDAGVYHRTSFAETGALASPELSPIPQKKSGKDRAMKLFAAAESDDARHTDEENDSFGLGVRQQLGMDQFEAASSQPSLPSPNISPIAFKANDGSTLLKSRSAGGDGSLLLSCAKTLQWSPGHSPSMPQPFSDDAGKGTAQNHRAMMEMDAFSAGCLQSGGHSMKEMSVMDAGDVEGGSGVDTFQHRSSSSNPDTGYHTASGSGSLQLTHQDAGLQPASTEGAPSDSSALFASIESKLRYRDGQSGLQSLNTSGAGDCLMQDSGLNSMVGPESIGLHSNLTNQFLNLPLRSEVGTDGCELDASMKSVSSSALSNYESQGFKEGQKDFRFPKWTADDVGTNDSSDNAPVEGRAKREKTDGCHPDQKIKWQHNVNFAVRDKDLHDKDVRVLGQVADILQKEMDENQQNFRLAKSQDPNTSHAFAESTARHNNTEDFFRKDRDDSVLDRARKYLAQVNGMGGMGSDHNVDDPGHEGETTTTPSSARYMPRPLRSSTPSKRMMGQLAKDLMAPGGVGEHGSPTLGSKVAMEILRRAEEDLMLFQNICSTDG